MWENGGPGIWATDYRDIYDLADDDWKYDAIPQIIDGMNVADYVDPDVDAKLAALEAEEEQLIREAKAAALGEEPESELDEEEEAAVAAIREKQIIAQKGRRDTKSANYPAVPRTIRGRPLDAADEGTRTASAITRHLEGYGIDASAMVERGRKRDRAADHRRKREEQIFGDVAGAVEGGGQTAEGGPEGGGVPGAQQKPGAFGAADTVRDGAQGQGRGGGHQEEGPGGEEGVGSSQWRGQSEEIVASGQMGEHGKKDKRNHLLPLNTLSTHFVISTVHHFFL